MIATGRAGKSFRALGAYLAERDESRVAWSETRGTIATDPRGAWAEMEADVSDTESRVEKPVYHVIISFDPGDEPTDAELRGTVDRTLRDLGLENHQALAVRHSDTDHDHVHIMVNRVGADGKAWSTSNDAYKLRASVEAQERELGVRWTGRNAERVAQAERAAEASRASQPARDKGYAAEVRVAAGADFREATSWRDLDRRLAAHGLRVERRGQGAVVTDGEREAKLSSVSRTVSRGRLESRFGSLREHDRGGQDGSRALAKEARPSVTQRRAVPRREVRTRRAGSRVAGSASRRAVGIPSGPSAVLRKALRQSGEEKDPLVQAAQRSGGRALRAATQGVQRTRPALAERRALAARERDSRERPRLLGLTARRETRQVDRVVSLVAQVQAEERRRVSLGGAAALSGRVNSTVRLAQVAGEASQALETHLGQVYRDPGAARARVLQAAEQVGPARAAKRLTESPETFGKLTQGPAGLPSARPWSRLLGKGSASAPSGHGEALRADVTPLVERAHHARTAAAQAIGGLGRGVGGAELGRAADRRTERLGRSVSGGLGRSHRRSPTESLAASVRQLTPAQRVQVAERVGRVGLAAVSRSIEFVKALTQGLER